MADVVTMLTNLASNINPLMKLVTGAAYMIGISFAVAALYHLKIYGELRTMMASQTSIKEPIFYLLTAAVFIFLPTGIGMVMQTTFGYDSVLAYSRWPGAGGSSLSIGAIAGLRVVQLVGMISFVRGWIMLAKSQKQGTQMSFGRALMHIVGGIFALNIVGTAEIVSNTLGISL